MSRKRSTVRAASALRALALVAVTLLILSAQAASATAPSDDFNRANGSLGASWAAVSDGALKISSQAVVGTSATAGDIRTAETYTNDQLSQIQLTSTQLSGGQWVGPTVRTQNGGQNTYLGIYFWNNGSPQLRLYKRISGTWIQLGSSYNSGALAAGTTLQLSAVGSTISFLQNGVSRITATDTSLTGGAPGIMTYGKAKADNWVGGGSTGTRARLTRSAAAPPGSPGRSCSSNNGGDDLTLTANGPFTFATKLASAPPTTSPSRRTRAARPAASPTAAARSPPPTSRNVAVSCAAKPDLLRSAAAPPGSRDGRAASTTAATTYIVTANGTFASRDQARLWRRLHRHRQDDLVPADLTRAGHRLQRRHGSGTIMTFGSADADNWAGAGATGTSNPTYSVGGSSPGSPGRSCSATTAATT